MNYAEAVARLADLTWGNPPLLRLDEFRDSLGWSQVVSKRELATMFWLRMKTVARPGPLVIDASWWGNALLHLLDHPARAPGVVTSVVLVDVDPRMARAHSHLWQGVVDFGDSGHLLSSQTRDIVREASPETYRFASSYINTSLEHLPPDFQLPRIDDRGLYFLQSNNMLFAEGHINCMPNSQAFVAWVRNQGLLVLESSVLNIGGADQRYTVVARRG